MAQSTQRPKFRTLMGAIGFIVTMVLVFGVLWNGLSGMWEIINKTVGPITIGSPDPKKPYGVIPPYQVMCIVLAIAIFGLMSFVADTFEGWEQAEKAKTKSSAEEAQRLEVVEAEQAKRLQDAEAVLSRKTALEADLEAKRAAFEEEVKAERERIRQVVEVEWQRDKKLEIERAHGQYLGYLERDRIAKARYEAAKLQRSNHLAQLEEYVLNTYPAFKMKNDPAGLKAPDVVASAFCKDVVKRWKTDAGLLRNSTDLNVLVILGSMDDLPLSPPPISEPVLIPMPENLRRRFEGQQVQNVSGYIDN